MEGSWWDHHGGSKAVRIEQGKTPMYSSKANSGGDLVGKTLKRRGEEQWRKQQSRRMGGSRIGHIGTLRNLDRG